MVHVILKALFEYATKLFLGLFPGGLLFHREFSQAITLPAIGCFQGRDDPSAEQHDSNRGRR